MTKKGNLLVIIIASYWTNRFSIERKNSNTNVWPDFIFLALDYRPPPQIPTYYSHILCKI